MALARKEGESFEDYKKRRAEANKADKARKHAGWWHHQNQVDKHGKPVPFSHAEQERQYAMYRAQVGATLVLIRYIFDIIAPGACEVGMPPKPVEEVPA